MEELLQIMQVIGNFMLSRKPDLYFLRTTLVYRNRNHTTIAQGCRSSKEIVVLN